MIDLCCLNGHQPTVTLRDGCCIGLMKSPGVTRKQTAVRFNFQQLRRNISDPVAYAAKSYHICRPICVYAQ
jgi:hypothetical protein